MTSTARTLTALLLWLVSGAAKSPAQPLLTPDEIVEQFERDGWTMQLKLGEPIIQAADRRA